MNQEGKEGRGTLITWPADRLPRLRDELLELEREETDAFHGENVGPTYYLRMAFIHVIHPYMNEHIDREADRHLLQPVFAVIEEMASDGRAEFHEILLTEVVNGIGGDTAKGMAAARACLAR